MTDKSAAAVRELAEKWAFTQCKDECGLLIDFDRTKAFISDLTALIEEYYYPKEKYDELLQQRDELREALTELVHLHGCEQEGIGSGQPTPKQWYDAVNKAEAAIKNTETK